MVVLDNFHNTAYPKLGGHAMAFEISPINRKGGSIDMLPLHHLSHMPCHAHLASNMHCFGCCPFPPYDISDIAHEETPIVSSYMLGDFDSSYPLHDPNTCVHNMLPMNENAIAFPTTLFT